MSQSMNICLWFKDQAEEAATFYTSIFNDSEIGKIARFGKEGFEMHGQPEGKAMAVNFRLNQMNFVALNGAQNTFSEVVSVMVMCDTQAEIDYYWEKLSEGGEVGFCGWLKDKFGVSWQINPTFLPDYLTDEDIHKRANVQKVAFQMKKFEIDKLESAYRSGS